MVWQFYVQAAYRHRILDGMQFAVDLIVWALPVLYALAAVLSIHLFVRPGGMWKGTAMPLLGVTVGLHLLSLVLRAVLTRLCPLGSIADATGLTGFALASVYFVLELKGGRRPTGILILPLAFLLVLVGTLLAPESAELNPALASPWFSIHSLAAVLGVAALAVSFVHGVFYLLLYREIRDHRFGRLFRRLPPLAVLNRMTQKATVIGWALLLVTILAGGIWASRSDNAAKVCRDPLFLVTTGAWLLYSVGLAVRFLAGWRGRYVVYLSVTGFVLLMVSLTAVSLIWPSLHAFR